jgi:hypothetical protein
MLLPNIDTSYLLISLVFSSIGLGYFIYGKKQKHKPALLAGIGLMGLPYVVYEPAILTAISLALMALPKAVRMLDK